MRKNCSQKELNLLRYAINKTRFFGGQRDYFVGPRLWMEDYFLGLVPLELLSIEVGDGTISIPICPNYAVI